VLSKKIQQAPYLVLVMSCILDRIRMFRDARSKKYRATFHRMLPPAWNQLVNCSGEYIGYSRRSTSRATSSNEYR